MRRVLSISLATLICATTVSAQLTGLTVETVTVHDGSIPELAGYTTYRVYADLTSEFDFVSAVYGDDNAPLLIGCTDGSFFQSTPGGQVFDFVNGINPAFFGAFPELEYDSWFAIGGENSDAPNAVDPVGEALNNGLDLFNQGDGFVVNDAFGGSWFNLFDCTGGSADLANCAAENPAFAGEENRVLLAQLTANGEVYGILNVQVLVGGDQSVLQMAENLTFSSDEDAVFGCTVGLAENYNPDATLDDLSCVYTCTLALEESSVVAPTCNGENDGSLQVIATGAQGADYFFLDSIPGGAFDEPTAFGGQNFGNFSDELAGEYLVWVFDGAGCTASLLVTIPVTDPVAIELVQDSLVSCPGADDAVVSIASATGGNGGYTFYISNEPEVPTTQTQWSGLSGNQSYSIFAIDSEGCQGTSNVLWIPEPKTCSGCTDPIACNYDAAALEDDGSCSFSCPGCTIPIACNYNPAAILDDGSCFFFCPGCTDEEACNFDAEALQDDGSCFYPESEGFCDCDGSQVDALGDCGGSCEADADSDGVCDDIDPCIGNFDECGICKGPGPIYECGCTSISAGNCDCEGNQLDAIGTCGGNCQSDADADGICDDIDDCIGEYDECGVCGGSGIPEGACNCAGELLDDCGVCGGDNTSCLGCTYELACNYDPEAILLDASTCEFGTCGGCIVIGACNYNPTLTIDDGSCEWCGCLEESSISDTGGMWEGDGTYFLSIEAYPATAVPGATTYRFYVNFDDANDQISAVFGSNENPLEVNVPEGAFNTTLNSSWNASGINPAFLTLWPEIVDDTFATLGLEGPASTSGIAGAADPQISEDGGQPITPFFLTDGATSLLSNSIYGASWFTLNTYQNAYAGDDLRTLVMQITTTGGISGTLNYQVFNQFDPSPEAETEAIQISSSFDVDFSQGIGGCTDTEAPNYCPQAMFDDGSCLDSYVGCLDEEACNYSATATTDVGAECLYPQGTECDCDGNVLDECGVCGGDGIPEGTCDCEGNQFDECGVCGGSGIPEGQCDCEGNVPDECGVCGGEGIPEGDCDCNGNVLDECGECGGQGIAEGTCDCDGNMLDALGVCGGDCLIDQNNNGICDIDELGVGSCGPESCGPGTAWDEETQACIVAYPADINLDGCVQLNDLLDLLQAYGNCAEVAEESWQCGDPLEYQGYDYATVLIGDQCWFAENLRSELYLNGDSIPTGLSGSEWDNTSSGAVAVYGEGSSYCFHTSPDGDACDESWSLNEYGRFYNGYAVGDVRGLCPSGWHVATDGEWVVLTGHLGEVDAAEQMKTTYGWVDGGNGTNASGFSGLPGGYYGNDGSSATAGLSAYWYSSSFWGTGAWVRQLSSESSGVGRYPTQELGFGFSVRCVLDAE